LHHLARMSFPTINSSKVGLGAGSGQALPPASFRNSQAIPSRSELIPGPGSNYRTPRPCLSQAAQGPSIRMGRDCLGSAKSLVLLGLGLHPDIRRLRPASVSRTSQGSHFIHKWTPIPNHCLRHPAAGTRAGHEDPGGRGPGAQPPLPRKGLIPCLFLLWIDPGQNSLIMHLNKMKYDPLLPQTPGPDQMPDCSPGYHRSWPRVLGPARLTGSRGPAGSGPPRSRRGGVQPQVR